MTFPTDKNADLVAYYGKRMRRWSAEKLERESVFALPCSDGPNVSPEGAWAAAIMKEYARRGLPLDLPTIS